MTRPLDHFTGVPRPGQVEALEWAYAAWNQADVLVISAPVGEGKSLIADAISRWVASARSGIPEGGSLVAVPNNILLDQYLATCRGFDTLRRRNLYTCHEDAGSCEDRAALVGRHCAPPGGNWYAHGACPYVRDLRRARSARRLVLTLHAKLAHKLTRDVLIVDEAHGLRDFLRDLSAVRIWRHEFGWRSSLRTVSDVLRWLPRPSGGDDERIQLLRETLTGREPAHIVDFSPRDWRGEERECVSLIPMDVSRRGDIVWGQASKIVLMSATINKIDIAQLGLNRRRVAHLELPSSIPADQRRVVFHPVADMRFACRSDSYPKMAAWILDEFLPAHAGERGLVHATYEFASALRAYANSAPSGRESARRLVFHDAGDKTAKLQSFLSAGTDSVLVGSGMREGLDLRGDLARFQLITAVPRGDISDPATARQVERAPQDYEWDTLRELIQASGRVCRGADDWGVTVIADSSASRELSSGLLPPSWAEAVTRIE